MFWSLCKLLNLHAALAGEELLHQGGFFLSEGFELGFTARNFSLGIRKNCRDCPLRHLPLFLDHSADELAAYAGQYSAALSDYALAVRDGELWLQATPKGGFPDKNSKPGPPPPPVRLAVCTDELIVALDPPFKGGRGEFLRAHDGSIAWMRFGGRIAKRQ